MLLLEPADAPRAMAALLIGVPTSANWISAQRAAGVDPMRAGQRFRGLGLTRAFSRFNGEGLRRWMFPSLVRRIRLTHTWGHVRLTPLLWMARSSQEWRARMLALSSF